MDGEAEDLIRRFAATIVSGAIAAGADQECNRGGILSDRLRATHAALHRRALPRGLRDVIVTLMLGASDAGWAVFGPSFGKPPPR